MIQIESVKTKKESGNTQNLVKKDTPGIGNDKKNISDD